MSKPVAASALAALCLMATVAVAEEGADEALYKVTQAVAKGYGADCALSAERASGAGDAYYRCLDVGPYRFVMEYGKVRGYVVPRGGGRPFPILESRDGRTEFLVAGPWVRDLAPKVEAWWSDEVEGGRSRREGDEAEARRLREAEEAVNGYSGAPPEGTNPAQGTPPDQAQPQPPADAPPPVPAYAAQPPYAGGYAPPEYGAPQVGQPGIDVPPGARLLAPGVVQAPAGTR